MRRIYLLGIFCFTYTVEAVELFSETKMRIVSEPMAIKPFTEDFDAALGDGDLAWTRNRFRTGVQYDHWSLAYIQDYDYNFHFNKSTLALYYRDKNDLGIPLGQSYPINLQVWQLRSQGLQLGYQYEFSTAWEIGVQVNLLQGWTFQDGSMQGVLVSGNDEFNGNATIEYRYSEDMLFEHRAEPSSGEGASLDLMVTWSQQNTLLTIAWYDALGFMDWKSAPYTDGAVSTIGRVVSPEVSLEPAFSGYRGVADYRQDIPSYATVDFQQQMGDIALKVDGEYFLSRVWSKVGLTWNTLITQPYVGYEFREEQIFIGLGGDYWQFQLGTDEWRFEKARSITLSFSVSFPIM